MYRVRLRDRAGRAISIVGNRIHFLSNFTMTEICIKYLEKIGLTRIVNLRTKNQRENTQAVFQVDDTVTKESENGLITALIQLVFYPVGNLVSEMITIKGATE